MVFEDTGRCLRRARSHLRPRGPDFPHISERFLQQNAASSENLVLSGREGENEADNQETWVLSGPPHNSEQDTAVDFVSDTPSERAVTFNDNPVAGTRYIPLRLQDTPQEPRPPPAALPFDPMTPATDAIPMPETTEQREEDHDNVPDTGLSTDSSAADTSGTSESSPGSSSTAGPMRQQIRPPLRPVVVLQAVMAQLSQTVHQVPHHLQDRPVRHVLRKLCQPRFQADHLHHLWQIAPWK